MTALKIAAIVGSAVIAAGGSAAVATRSKWLPKSENSDTSHGNGEEVGVTQPQQVSQPDQKVTSPGKVN